MQLHLFSTPGENDIRYIVEACHPYLKDKKNSTVAFMPLASHANDWMEYTVRQFDGLGIVKKIDTDAMSLDEMKDIISQASVIYISGGNTFLLNHRLHTSGLMLYLREAILNGLPLVGFSAGAILCGANILTSEDMNMIETNHFAGLNL
jgi:dipeptidase E